MSNPVVPDPIGVKGADGANIASPTNRLPVDAEVSVTLGEVEITNDSGNPVPVSGTVTANQGTAGTANWKVTDKPDVMEAAHATLVASTSTPFTFTAAVEVVRVKNWDTANRVLVKSSAISSDTDATASRVGKAPATDLPNSEFYPVSGTIYLRAGAAVEVTVEGFRKS